MAQQLSLHSTLLSCPKVLDWSGHSTQNSRLGQTSPAPLDMTTRWKGETTAEPCQLLLLLAITQRGQVCVLVMIHQGTSVKTMKVNLLGTVQLCDNNIKANEEPKHMVSVPAEDHQVDIKLTVGAMAAVDESERSEVAAVVEAGGQPGTSATEKQSRGSQLCGV